MHSPKPQVSAYHSPWSSGSRLRMAAWCVFWIMFCRWTPKPFNPWRLFILKLFGASIEGTPFVHQRARIQIPWNMTFKDRSCLGDRSNAYSLGNIVLGEGCTIAQEAYLCTGTHDFEDASLSLKVGEICVGSHAFIGARAFVLPNVSIGDGAIVGACAVVTRNVDPKTIVAGNPAKPVDRS